MYRWVPGKRTRVQSEPAPSDCVWPLEFDRFREGQNPPLFEIGFCTGLCKGSLDNRCTTGLGKFGDHPFHAAHPLLRARWGGEIVQYCLPFRRGARFGGQCAIFLPSAKICQIGIYRFSKGCAVML